MIMQNFSVPTKDQVSTNNQTIFDNLQKGLGFVPNLYAYIAKNDTGLGDYLAYQNRKSSLTAKEKEVVNLKDRAANYEDKFNLLKKERDEANERTEKMKKEDETSTFITVNDVCYTCSNGTNSTDICYSDYDDKATFDASKNNLEAAGFPCVKQ